MKEYYITSQNKKPQPVQPKKPQVENPYIDEYAKAKAGNSFELIDYNDDRDAQLETAKHNAWQEGDANGYKRGYEAGKGQVAQEIKEKLEKWFVWDSPRRCYGITKKLWQEFWNKELEL